MSIATKDKAAAMFARGVKRDSSILAYGRLFDDVYLVCDNAAAYLVDGDFIRRVLTRLKATAEIDELYKLAEGSFARLGGGTVPSLVEVAKQRSVGELTPTDLYLDAGGLGDAALFVAPKAKVKVTVPAELVAIQRRFITQLELIHNSTVFTYYTTVAPVYKRSESTVVVEDSGGMAVAWLMPMRVKGLNTKGLEALKEVL